MSTKAKTTSQVKTTRKDSSGGNSSNRNVANKSVPNKNASNKNFSNRNTSNKSSSSIGKRTSTRNASSKKTSSDKKGKDTTKKASAKKSSRKKANKTQSTLKKRIKTGLKLILAGTLIVCLFLLIKYGSMLLNYKAYASELVAERDVFKQSLTTVVYDNNGEVIANLCAERDSYYLTCDEIPYLIKHAFVTTEDRKFYEHSGLDYKAIVRAFVALIENDGEVTQGGSTITQQLARNIFLSHEVSIERKIKEMFIATELENTYSKDEILEFYINNIYFGNGFYGIEAAARGYFDKTVTDLTNSEMLFLCAIPNSPSKYDPVSNIDATITRRDLIASVLKEQGEIDQTLYDEIINEIIMLNPSKNIKHDYVETFVRYCATRELMRARGFVFLTEFSSEESEKAYREHYDTEYSYCNNLLFTGGYRIYTTIDMAKQDELQATIDSTMSEYQETNDSGIYAFQASATTIDNLTGFVVAIVGGREQEHVGYSLNRAFQSFRQPGSSIKPLVVYTPAFERGYTPDTIVLDEKFSGGPSNADKTYLGKINIRTAVEKSKNTIAWKLFETIGTHTCLNYITKMDFKKIVQTDYVPAASLGGLTYGVSSYEMASAYSTIENSGVYRNPTCILKITDDDGNIVLDNTGNSAGGKVIYEANAANTMTNVLKGVLIRGTGRKYQIDNAICAAKTGTTNNNYDSWFVGYSYYYTTSVWCGYDMPRAMDNAATSCAGKIWDTYMTYLHNSLAKIDIGSYVATPGIESEIPTEVPTEPQTDENGNLIGEPVESETDENGNLIEKATDENGNPIESETDENGNLIENPDIESETDENGNLIKNPDIESETDENGNLIKNPDIESETDENGNLIKNPDIESETDENGNLINSPDIEPETDEYGNLLVEQI